MATTQYISAATRLVNYTNQPENIIGINATDADHLEKSRETENFEKSLKTVKKHCNQLSLIRPNDAGIYDRNKFM